MEALNADIELFVSREAEKHGRPGVLCGFADLSELAEITIDGEKLNCAISIASPLDAKVISEISNGPTREYIEESSKNISFLEDLGKQLSAYIKDKGFIAVPLNSAEDATDHFNCRNLNCDDIADAPSSKDVKHPWHSQHLPHRFLAAHAGLGWIGKSGLLVAKRYGSAIMLETVLTNAPLDCASEVFLSRCGRCRECANSCPAGAIYSVEWTPSDGVDGMVDVAACLEACRFQSESLFGQAADACGACIYSCPYTKSYLRREGLPYA